jgi:microcystin-dependent protein
MSSSQNAVFRRYSEFGKDINFNNDALAGRIADITINPTKNNMDIISSYGTAYFTNIDAITIDGDLTFFNTPSVTIDNVKHYAVPTGTIIMYPSATPPSGWLVCNGQAVSRGTYALLYSYIGTTYGSGNGSSTFNLPDIRDRMVIQQDTGISRYNTLGKTGGVNGIIFTEANLPKHTHNSATSSSSDISIAAWNHSHSYTRYGARGASGLEGWGAHEVKNSPTSENSGSADGLKKHSHTGTTTTNIYKTTTNLGNIGTGGEVALNPTTAQKTVKNIQPSQYIYYIIKT